MHREPAPAIFLAKQLWRYVAGVDAPTVAMLRDAARIGWPIDSCEDIGNGKVRVWFARGSRTLPARISATPWILDARAVRFAGGSNVQE